MGRGRVIAAISILVAFLWGYSLLLWNMSHTFIADSDEMKTYLIRTYNLKVLIFSVYTISNCIMSRGCKTRLENEILLAGLFSTIFITVVSALHYGHILIIPLRFNLILFNGVSIVLIMSIFVSAYRHGYLK